MCTYCWMPDLESQKGYVDKLSMYILSPVVSSSYKVWRFIFTLGCRPTVELPTLTLYA